MNKQKLGFVATLTILVFTGATLFWSAQPWDTRPRGERLYAAHCARCHGAEGEGGTGMVLNSAGHMYQHTCSQLKLHIAVGSRGSGYMPSHWGKLSNEEITDIAASFQRWWTDEQIAEFQARSACVADDVAPSIIPGIDFLGQQ